MLNHFEIILHNKFIPILSIVGTSKCIHRQAETNKPSVLWMHVQRLDIRLESWTSNQLSGPVWSRAKSNSLRLLWRSQAVTNMNHHRHHWAASQEINTAGEARGPTRLPVMFGPRWTSNGERLDQHTNSWQALKEGDKTSNTLSHSSTLC